MTGGIPRLTKEQAEYARQSFEQMHRDHAQILRSSSGREDLPEQIRDAARQQVEAYEKLIERDPVTDKYGDATTQAEWMRWLNTWTRGFAHAMAELNSQKAATE